MLQPPLVSASSSKSQGQVQLRQRRKGTEAPEEGRPGGTTLGQLKAAHRTASRVMRGTSKPQAAGLQEAHTQPGGPAEGFTMCANAKHKQ